MHKGVWKKNRSIWVVCLIAVVMVIVHVLGSNRFQARKTYTKLMRFTMSTIKVRQRIKVVDIDQDRSC